ncbi:unnamed protein product [Clonostachys chloroleuca]|uniref:CMP/dCMP-type deaminase domain-containing protein n=1 Tax=Clonostachys chloroleuca TaxID=1926264 RepID=A0AA35PYB0_9HYPO|nr:unnamed protein product [Clonostachys chloroleuca]
MSAPAKNEELLRALLQTVETSIVPLTAQAVTKGCKLFGAAILDRRTLKPLSVATNNERASPLLHGEINCIQQFYTVDYPDPASRPSPQDDCVFFATHEPCSLCLSGITWSGFREFYYLFTYEDSRDLFSIPYDIDILQEVFRVQGSETDEQVKARPLYNRDNKFFKARSVAELIDTVTDAEAKAALLSEFERVKKLYNGLSETYQNGKSKGTESSSVWK